MDVPDGDAGVNGSMRWGRLANANVESIRT